MNIYAERSLTDGQIDVFKLNHLSNVLLLLGECIDLPFFHCGSELFSKRRNVDSFCIIFHYTTKISKCLSVSLVSHATGLVTWSLNHTHLLSWKC